MNKDNPAHSGSVNLSFTVMRHRGELIMTSLKQSSDAQAFQHLSLDHLPVNI